MIDLHCHLLPFIDDGASDWEASLAMARMAVDDGITQTVATPHWTGAPGEMEKITTHLEELRVRLEGAGLPLRLHLGNEVVLMPRLVEALQSGRAKTLGGSSYILLETAQLEHGAYTQSALFQLQSSGYRIILAHPERVKSWHGSVAPIRDFLARGCSLQINATSVLGGFGPVVRKQAEELLRLRWVSILASDAHSPRSRPPLLAEARRRCADLIGVEAANTLVQRNPARVLCNEELPYVDIDAVPERRSWFSLFRPKRG